jgi:broad specificity phosphatase PhoE
VLRDALRPLPLAAVYSSPLARAQETAAVVAAPRGLSPILHDGLREIGVGVWEGLLMDEIEQRYAQILREWWDRPHLTRIPGGETLDELRTRAMQAVGEIRARFPTGTVAVVAHGGVNKTILLTALGAPLASYWRIRQANTCINMLEYEDDRARVVILNHTAHLAALGPEEERSSGTLRAARRLTGSDRRPSPETW